MINITQTNNLTFRKYNTGLCEKKENKEPYVNFDSKKACQKENKIPLTSLKANFLPSFGKYKKVGDVQLFDREHGNFVKADLKKEKIGNYVSYKIYKGKEEEGYIDIDKKSLFPEGDFVLTEPDNVIPEVLHLRSLNGNKYAGIGTALVNAAVKESISEGKEGCIWTQTEKGYAHGLSDYRKNQNPIPFYYKLGFKSISPKTDELIKKCIETSNCEKLPDSAILLLTPEAIKKSNKYFANFKL